MIENSSKEASIELSSPKILPERNDFIVTNKQNFDGLLTEERAFFLKSAANTLRAKGQKENVEVIAKDIFQDAAVRIYDYLKKYPDAPISLSREYFLAVLNNAAVSWHRKEHPEKYEILPSGDVNVSEKHFESSLSSKEPLPVEEEVDASMLYDYVFREGTIGNQEFNPPLKVKDKKIFERNLKILRMRLEGYNSKEIAQTLQEDDDFRSTYNLENPEELKKAINTVDKSYERILEMVRESLETPPSITRTDRIKQ